MNPSPRIGVIGVGNMGLGMALRLRDRAWVSVRDIDPAREALAAAGGCRCMPRRPRWPPTATW
jgi:3-hydroxyisobutyrate dehydrogenase-like beta-hydroxyacid dehydrogenase